jgi:hypothetical protein
MSMISFVAGVEGPVEGIRLARGAIDFGLIKAHRAEPAGRPDRSGRAQFVRTLQKDTEGQPGEPVGAEKRQGKGDQVLHPGGRL